MNARPTPSIPDPAAASQSVLTLLAIEIISRDGALANGATNSPDNIGETPILI